MRDLLLGEREALAKILETASFVGVSELREQLPRTKVVVGGLPSFLDLEVERNTAASALQDGPIPVRAFVEEPGGECEGELIVWVTEGYLSARGEAFESLSTLPLQEFEALALDRIGFDWPHP